MHSAAGRVNWVEVERDWQSLGLPVRTKAALTAKFRSVGRAAAMPSPAQRVASNVSELVSAPAMAAEPNRVPAQNDYGIQQTCAVGTSSGDVGNEALGTEQVGVRAAFAKRPPRTSGGKPLYRSRVMRLVVFPTLECPFISVCYIYIVCRSCRHTHISGNRSRRGVKPATPDIPPVKTLLLALSK